MTASFKSEDWERTDDGRLIGSFDIVTLQQPNQDRIWFGDPLGRYVAVLTYQQSGVKRDFIAQGPPDQRLEHALAGLLSVTSATLNEIKERVLNYGGGGQYDLEQVGEGVVLAAPL